VRILGLSLQIWQENVASSKRKRRVIEDDDEAEEKQTSCTQQQQEKSDASSKRSREEESKQEVVPASSEVSMLIAPPAETAEGMAADDERPSLPKAVQDIITWPEGAQVPYKVLADTFQRIESITGRLEITNILTTLFRAVIAATPNDLAPIVFLCCNQVAPAYENVELGIGDSLLIKAIVEATGRTRDMVKTQYEELGDLGLVAAASRSTQRTLSFGAKPKPLTAVQVLEQLR
jgi:DNA ligase-1